MQNVWLIRRLPGVLVECDPSIKAIILKIDSAAHDYIVEDLDDQTLVIKDSMLPKLKARLQEVRYILFPGSRREYMSYGGKEGKHSEREALV